MSGLAVHSFSIHLQLCWGSDVGILDVIIHLFAVHSPKKTQKSTSVKHDHHECVVADGLPQKGVTPMALWVDSASTAKTMQNKGNKAEQPQ